MGCFVVQEQLHIYPYRRLNTDDTPGKEKLRKDRHKGGGRLKVFLPVHWFSLEGLFFFTTCFVLSKAQILGGISPFGLAFYAAAVSSYRRYLWPMFFALLLGQAVVYQDLRWGINAAVFTLFTFWQVIFPVNFTKRWIILPVGVFLITTLVKAGWVLLSSFVLYKIIAVLVEGVLAAGLVAVYFSCLNTLQAKKIPFGLSSEETVCAVIFCLSFCAGILDVVFRDLSLGNIVSRYLILATALIGGGGAGAALGSVLGIMPSIITINAPVLVGIYAFSGLLAGVLAQWNKIGAGIGFLLGNLLLSVYLLDQQTITTAFSESAIAVILLFLTPNRLILRLRSVSTWKGMPAAVGDYRRYGELLRLRILDVVRTFEELSHSFLQHAPAPHRVEEEKIQGLFNAVAKGVCERCPIYTVCWEKDFYNTYKSILSAFGLVETGGIITQEQLPPELSRRCTRGREMAATLSCLYDTYRVERFWRRKIAESQNLMAVQLQGVAGVLKATAEDIRSEGYFHEELEVSIADTLEKAGFHLEDVQVWKEARRGNLEINLNLAACPGGNPCEYTILPLLSDLVGHPLMLERRQCGSAAGSLNCELRLLPLPSLRVVTGFAQEAKNQRQICGDSCAMFDLPGGKFALILSDGMGVGAKAARESETAVLVLERLLLTGFQHCVAVQMLNSLLLLRAEEETFATVDLAIIDRYTGETEFLKIGSAPSFVVRKNKVWAINNSTLPAGIITNIPLEPTVEMLQAGDILVMLTDGLLEADKKAVNQEEWLVGILQNNVKGTPQQIAEQILRQVKISAQERRSDDLSVLVAQIEWETA